jgi:hypothetical protein
MEKKKQSRVEVTKSFVRQGRQENVPHKSKTKMLDETVRQNFELHKPTLQERMFQQHQQQFDNGIPSKSLDSVGTTLS